MRELSLNSINSNISKSLTYLSNWAWEYDLEEYSLDTKAGKCKGFPRKKEDLLNLRDLELDLFDADVEEDEGETYPNLPDEFEVLQNLNVLKLRGDFERFPKAICKLSNLTELDLSRSYIKDLPREFGNLKNLNVLNLSSNKFENVQNLANLLGKLPNLLEINLSNCGLKYLPKFSFNGIQSLILSQNSFKILGEESGDFRDFSFDLSPFDMLKKLDLSACHLKELPQSIVKPTLLWELKLNQNKALNLSKITPTLCEMPSLLRLELGACKINNLPDNFAKVQQIDLLKLNDNPLRCVPKALLRLKNLRFLSLDNTKISSLPREFANLHHLEAIAIRGTRMREFPEVLLDLPHLKHVFLNENLLSERILDKIYDKKTLKFEVF